ncbi:hypothetical protein D3C76_1868690 [compost metagenome]
MSQVAYTGSATAEAMLTISTAAAAPPNDGDSASPKMPSARIDVSSNKLRESVRPLFMLILRSAA